MSEAWVSVFGECYVCAQPFTFHPNRVPSLRVGPQDTREPVCRSCFDRLNAARLRAGLEAWPEPLPGAYEAAPESEVLWDD